MKTFKSLFIIYFFTILFGTNVILADELSLVNDSGMISELPNGLTFFVDVNDEKEISDIAVKFRVLDRSAVQYDYFDLKKSKSSNRKEYYFNTKAANSYIPPVQQWFSNWSVWNTLTNLTIENLDEGNYTFY